MYEWIVTICITRFICTQWCGFVGIGAVAAVAAAAAAAAAAAGGGVDKAIVVTTVS